MTDSAPPPSGNSRPPGAPGQRPDSPAAPLILASGSPRRVALLREAGYAFTTIVSNVDESDHPAALSAKALALHLAERKARAVAAAFPHAVVLGADTVVAVRQPLPHSPAAEPLGSRGSRGSRDSRDSLVEPREFILGKPTDLADARRILGLLSGTTHQVITAVALIRLDPAFAEIAAVHSTVHMRPLTPAELDAYLASGQWQGKAGAYGIQDNDPFVTAITGCHTNIVGLPMTTTSELLAKVGVLPAPCADK